MLRSPFLGGIFPERASVFMHVVLSALTLFSLLVMGLCEITCLVGYQGNYLRAGVGKHFPLRARQ